MAISVARLFAYRAIAPVAGVAVTDATDHVIIMAPLLSARFLDYRLFVLVGEHEFGKHCFTQDTHRFINSLHDLSIIKILNRKQENKT